ncbi:S8 family serine peptidase, partial [Candidatus Poribacteria bacterium]|nr:S8 family serine peptidase [Candidatus Poribacteria bacterium]
MRNAYRSILGFGIIAFTLLSLQIANTKQTTVGKPPFTDNILRSKMAFAVVGEEIARGLNLHTLSESDHWKLRGPVLLEQQTDIHFLLREQYGRIVNTVYFGAALDASSPSQNLSISPENRPVLYQKAAEIIRDFIAERDISVIIRSNAPIGIGEIAAIRRLRGEVPYTYEIINSAAVSVPLKNIAALIKLPFITEIWPNSKGRLALADSIREIGADKVHKPPHNGLGVTGKGVTVAVVDNGISQNTPALSKVRITKNKGGFNSGRTGAQLRHGTIMAEIIGAAQHTHNSITRTGVAPEVDFFDARITVNIGETEYGDQMDALEWAANEGADVINLSANHAPWKYSRRGDDPMSQLIDKLVVDHRVVVVNSAGNRASKRESGKIQGKGVTHTYTFNSGNVNEVAVHLVWDNKSNDLDLAIFDDRGKEICSSHQGLVDQIFDKVLPNRYGESVRCPVNPGQDYTVRVKTYNQSSFQEYEVWLDIDNISTNFGHPNREKTVGVPGYSAKVITVGAVDRNNSITDYSSQGPSDTGLIKPEVVAPGEVWTTAGSVYWNSTGPALGTSVAAPHVSGVAALILDAVGKNSAGEWNFSPAEVKSAIVRGAENFMGNPPDNEHGAGLVRADKIIFGDEVKPHATKRFKITPALLGYKFQAGYLNAENNYSPNTIPNYVDYVAAISWEGNDSLELKLINQIRTLPERILADTTNSKDPNVQQGSNYRKIAGFSLSTNQGGLSGTLYLDVHNQGNKAIRFTGASTQPIAPAVVPILPKVGPTNPTTTAPPQGTSRLNLPEDAKMRLGKGDIHHIAYSPDGTLLATAGRVGVWLYDAETYQAVGLLRGHTHGVSTLAFSPDGKTIATGNSLVDTWANTVRLWDVDTRTEKNTLTTGLVKSIAFSRDGKTIATTDGRDEVRLWDVNTGTEKNPLTTGSVEKVAFSPDGKTIATADAGGLVRLWSVTFGVEMKVFTGYNGQVRSIAFSPDGKTIAGGGSDNTVRLWDVDTG